MRQSIAIEFRNNHSCVRYTCRLKSEITKTSWGVEVAKKRLTAVSLFSGCGGLDLGFENAGFDILSAHDIDPVAVKNYNDNLRSVSHLSDVSSPSFQIPKGIDLVISGSPCQGFSLVGKRDYFDPRNSLLLTACSLVAKSRPRAVLFENVPGALAGTFHSIWDEGVKKLKRAGYNVHFETLSMNDYGVPQMRKRVFLVGIQNGAAFSLRDALTPQPPASLKSTLASAHKYPSGDLFLNLDPGTIDWAIAQRISAGKKLCDVRAGERSVHSWSIPEVFGTTNAKERDILLAILRLRRQVRRRPTGDADPVEIDTLFGEFGKGVVKSLESLESKGYVVAKTGYVDLARRFNGKYRRSCWNSPSYTVDTNFGNPKYFLHPTEHRGFSVREAARIQGFPDTYIFNGTIRDQFRLIGNAVPPHVATQIAMQMRRALAS